MVCNCILIRAHCTVYDNFIHFQSIFLNSSAICIEKLRKFLESYVIDLCKISLLRLDRYISKVYFYLVLTKVHLLMMHVEMISKVSGRTYMIRKYQIKQFCRKYIVKLLIFKELPKDMAAKNFGRFKIFAK